MQFDGSSPRKPVSATHSPGSRSWSEWTQQLQAYVAWVNSQLRKKPGTKEVKDLRRELQDGTILVELIEIVANEKIPGTHSSPANSLEMKENIERVLQFMRSRKIKMHQIRSIDIVEGNMKSIMRLILALAAHFKPSSVKQSTNQSSKSSRSLGIAQEAASALASIRKDAECIKRKMHRPASLRKSDVEGRPTINRRLAYDQADVADLTRSQPPTDVAASPRSSVRSVTPKSSLDSESEGDLVDRYSSLLEDVQECQCALIDETKDAHALLVDLQNLLLNGEDDLELSLDIYQNSGNPEQLVIYKARMQQTEELCRQLREELSRTKQECMQLQGMKQGLHQRLSELQQEILQMKALKLRSDMVETDSEEMERLRDELTEKTTMLNRMHTELGRRDKTIARLEAELQLQSTHSGDIIKSLELQLSTTKSKLTDAEQKSSPGQSSSSSPCTTLSRRLDSKLELSAPVGEEIKMAESALESLKCSNPGNSVNIELLEKAFVAMVTRVKEAGKQPAKPTAEVKGHRVLSCPPPLQKRDSTKLLCFCSNSVTPSMKTVQKKLGEITLKDYKYAFPSGHLLEGGECIRLRYSFKSQDPEFGTVKEELSEDTDLVPGWEGKVIGWIEEDLA